MQQKEIMDLCVKQCKEGMLNLEGGPFGAAIVKDGKIIALANNTVIKDNDPTAHGEMNAIRQACNKLSTFDLSGCELYTTSEPCPMCMSAIIWSNISKVYYGCTVKDAADIGFRDEHILKFLKGNCTNKKVLDLEQIDKSNCMAAFEMWTNSQNKTSY
ncbi:nucleoside deaminase [Clostridium botulinum]|uniref:nucleoside deaminase n=1 Tax=Clostridium botulinum TaxID=1491 RepID=UPI0007733313|nr:nucleoside deaminase [Clostridium botulinum]